MMGQWESNISVWFPCMSSQKWNCYFQNRIICSVSQFILSYICKRFIYFQVESAFSAAGKYVDRSLEYINRSQTHKCGNWDWGRAIPRKGIHKRDFPWSACRDSASMANEDATPMTLPTDSGETSKSSHETEEFFSSKIDRICVPGYPAKRSIVINNLYKRSWNLSLRCKLSMWLL